MAKAFSPYAQIQLYAARRGRMRQPAEQSNYLFLMRKSYGKTNLPFREEPGQNIGQP